MSRQPTLWDDIDEPDEDEDDEDQRDIIPDPFGEDDDL